MNIKETINSSVDTAKENIKKSKKIVLIILIAFFIIGALIGLLQEKKISEEEKIELQKRADYKKIYTETMLRIDVKDPLSQNYFPEVYEMYKYKLKEKAEVEKAEEKKLVTETDKAKSDIESKEGKDNQVVKEKTKETNDSKKNINSKEKTKEVAGEEKSSIQKSSVQEGSIDKGSSDKNSVDIFKKKEEGLINPEKYKK